MRGVFFDLPYETLQFHVSACPTFDVQAYVRVSEGLYLGSRSWIKIFNKDKSYFRDQTINRFWSDPVKLTMKANGEQAVDLILKDDHWQFSNGKKADNEKIKAMLTQTSIKATLVVCHVSLVVSCLI